MTYLHKTLLKRLLTVIFLSVLLIHLNQCTPQQRLNNLLGKHPYLAKPQVKDTTLTVFEVDTVFVDGKSIDTFFSFYVDTFVVTDSGVTVTVIKEVDRWRVRTVVDKQTLLVNDTVRIKYTDTVNVFEVQPISGKEKWKYRWQGILWHWIILLILFLIYIAVRIYLKTQLPFIK